MWFIVQLLHIHHGRFGFLLAKLIKCVGGQSSILDVTTKQCRIIATELSLSFSHKITYIRNLCMALYTNNIWVLCSYINSCISNRSKPYVDTII